jgi:hypothetical protein
MFSQMINNNNFSLNETREIEPALDEINEERVGEESTNSHSSRHVLPGFLHCFKHPELHEVDEYNGA